MQCQLKTFRILHITCLKYNILSFIIGYCRHDEISLYLQEFIRFIVTMCNTSSTHIIHFMLQTFYGGVTAEVLQKIRASDSPFRVKIDERLKEHHPI